MKFNPNNDHNAYKENMLKMQFPQQLMTNFLNVEVQIQDLNRIERGVAVSDACW